MVKSKWPGSQLSVFPELSSSGFFCKYREMGNNTGQTRKSTDKSKRLISSTVFLYIPKILVPSTKYSCAGALLSKRIPCSSSPHRILQRQWLGAQGLAAGRLTLTGKLWWAFESPASGQGCPKARQPPSLAPAGLPCGAAPGAASPWLTQTAQAGDSQYCSCWGRLCAPSAAFQGRLVSGNSPASPDCQH